MNDLNSYSSSRFRISSAECPTWKATADRLRLAQSWKSPWFATAKRFFLSGGAKALNPKWDDVDRIADYATALEATLVPEKDFNTRRMSQRAGELLAREGLGDKDDIGGFFKRIYGIRSQIVHGDTLDDESREWLIGNSVQIELRMRQVLKAAVVRLPASKQDRLQALAGLYDLTDDERGEFALRKFRDIRSIDVRKSTAAEIAALAQAGTRRPKSH